MASTYLYKDGKIFCSSFLFSLLSPNLDLNDEFVRSRSTISFIIILDFLMFYEIFPSPEVKRCVIITDKHDVYELPHEFPNDLRLRILGN